MVPVWLQVSLFLQLTTPRMKWNIFTVLAEGTNQGGTELSANRFADQGKNPKSPQERNDAPEKTRTAFGGDKYNPTRKNPAPVCDTTVTRCFLLGPLQRQRAAFRAAASQRHRSALYPGRACSLPSRSGSRRATLPRQRDLRSPRGPLGPRSRCPGPCTHRSPTAPVLPRCAGAGAPAERERTAPARRGAAQGAGRGAPRRRHLGAPGAGEAAGMGGPAWRWALRAARLPVGGGRAPAAPWRHPRSAPFADSAVSETGTLRRAPGPPRGGRGAGRPGRGGAGCPCA